MIHIIKLLLVWGIPMIGSNYSLACSCEEPGTVQESFDQSDIVVYGKVLSRKYITFRETMKVEKGDSLNNILTNHINELLNSDVILKIEFEIKKTYKGTITTDTITVYTGRSSASCGFSRFKEGEEYLIYGSTESYCFGLFTEGENDNLEKQGTFWTSYCSRTKEYNDHEARELNKLAMK